MKNLLRKFHIGGHAPLDDIRNSSVAPLPPSSSSASTSSSTVAAPSTSSSSRGRAAAGGRSSSSSVATSGSSSRERSGDADGSLRSRGQEPGPEDFSLFEEEFQVQLALAISVSDPDGGEDPESAQINAATRMSLGCTPVATSGDGENNLVEILSQRYWNFNILNYDEKVTDGFYDVYGIINSSLQIKMPLLVDLQSASISDNVDYEVVIVNRTTDLALQQLERRAISVSLQCRRANLDPSVSGLIQKIADLVVDSMGGPVVDADDMLRRWTAKSYELRNTLNTIVLPLGCLEVGLSRHRALLFKVLADRIDLPCKLVKGSYYTGTDGGAVNMIKVDHRKEFIIDLMGAPGALIPVETPNLHSQNADFDLVDYNSISRTVRDLSMGLDSSTDWQLDGKNEGPERSSVDPHSGLVGLGSEKEEIYRIGPLRKRDSMSPEKRNDDERFEHDSGKFIPSVKRTREKTSGLNEFGTPARQLKVSDVSRYVVSAAKNPEFAQKLHAVLLESGASPPPDLFSDINILDGVGDQKDLEQGLETKEESNSCDDKFPPIAKPSLLPFLESDFPGYGGEGFEQHLPLNVTTKKQKEDSVSDINILNAHSAISPQNEGFMLHNAGSNELIKKMCVNNEGDCSQMELKNATSGTCQVDDGRIIKKFEIKAVLDDVADCEIPWEDLQIGERIGLGSYGEVYRADWNGTEVAVKKFLDQDLSGDALEQFRCEVKIMLRLRHPNVVLFMGAVTRPPNLSILTEFLPRGSLYRLLHRPKSNIDEKRRLRMAIDVAKGMNYLHTSHPTIVHRDLKSPNLLVDKNWVVKVCDFGLSRLKHHTFLSSKSSAGTPEWMAPEVLRNERSNEKCDVYSFGVILWELATLHIPWSGMNPMQVVGAVGFQNRCLDIPKEVDPMVAEIIRDCWHNEPDRRPSFAQLMAPLKKLQHLVVENP